MPQRLRRPDCMPAAGARSTDQLDSFSVCVERTRQLIKRVGQRRPRRLQPDVGKLSIPGGWRAVTDGDGQPAVHT
jgi:membrane-bound lytic murein transglycosylase MltF